MKTVVEGLFRKKWVALALFLTVLGAVIAGTFLMPREYESHMKVLVKNERADPVVSSERNLSSMLRGDVTEAQVNSEIELLSSSELLGEVVRLCDLKQEWLSKSDHNPEMAAERALEKLRGDLKITPVRRASVIVVSYGSPEPERSAGVLRVLAALYLDAHLKVHRTPGTYEFFRTQAAKYQAQMESAEAQLAELVQTNNLTLLGEQKALTLRRALEVEKIVQETRASAAENASRIKALCEQLRILSPRIVTQSRIIPNQYSVERLHTMLAELQNQRTRLLTKYRSDERLVVEVDRQIEDTRSALERAKSLSAVEEATDVNPLKQALENELARTELAQAGLEARHLELASQVRSTQNRLTSLEKATARHNDLERQLKEAEDNYLLYAKKQEEARVSESLDQQKIANVAIAEAPVASHLPSKPKVPLNLALGLLLASFVSVGTALSLDYSARVLHTPAELETVTGLPVLATVPAEGA